MIIDWNKKNCLISKHFTVLEATWLPSWGVQHAPNEQEKINIIATAQKMDLIRDILDVPIKVHCWIRPIVYNRTIGGAPKSSHISGLAVDFSTKFNCDAVRYILLPHLPALGVRMENLKGATWVHIGNDWEEGMQHFFKP